MENPKSNESNTPVEENGTADALASVAIIAVVVAAVCFWLLGMK